MVILYAYKEEPDMRKQILMKGNILELHAGPYDLSAAQRTAK